MAGIINNLPEENQSLMDPCSGIKILGGPKPNSIKKISDMKNYSLIFFLLLLEMPACKKKVPDKPDKTTLLTTGNWRLTDYYYRNAITTVTFSSLPDCRKDDYRIFNRDGTGEVNEGPTKCNSGDLQTHPMQWRFTNESFTRIDINGTEYIIGKLDDNNFQFHTPFTDPYAPETNYEYSK